jgi:hypothetical protein
MRIASTTFDDEETEQKQELALVQKTERVRARTKLSSTSSLLYSEN